MMQLLGLRAILHKHKQLYKTNRDTTKSNSVNTLNPNGKRF